MKTLNSKKGNYVFIIFLLTFFLVAIILPVFSMMTKINWASMAEFVRTDGFKTVLKNSVIVTSIATLVSVSLAYFFAYTISRSNVKKKNVLIILITLPMLIPSISHGIGIINFFGENGIFTNVLNINIDLFGIKGIILGSVLYSFPVAFLIFHNGFTYIDATLYEQSRVFGLSKIRTFFVVTLPYLKVPFISATFAVFTMIFTDYGVPLAVGGRYVTLPVYLYREVIGMLDFSKGAFIGMILLTPALLAFIIDLLKKDGVTLGFSKKDYIPAINKKRDILCTILLYAIMTIILLPIISFAFTAFVKKYPYDNSFTFEHVQYFLDMGFGNTLSNSLLIAFFTAAFGTIIAYLIAYATVRMISFANKFLHVLSMMSLAIPGLILGLSYVLFFKDTVIYQTIWLLILVNIVHFLASPYLIAYNALSKVDPNLESVGKSLGIKRVRLLFGVIIPCTLDTILEMFSYFFINAMITISAVTFLFNVETRPIALMIPQFEGQFMYEAAALVSLLILVANILLKIIIYGLQKILRKRIGLN